MRTSTLQIKAVARSFLAAALFPSIACLGLAQQKSAPASASVSAEQKWEYVVVSYGKSEFGSPQKTLAYRAIGLPGGQEAEELQTNLDILGRFGWEAVSFLGSIGGDQQIVLKRKYDKNRSASQGEAITRATALYIKDMVDILERERTLREAQQLAEEEAGNKPHLINLDAEDAKAAKAALLDVLRDSYTEALKRREFSDMSKLTVEYRNSYSSNLDVEVVVDLTKRFLKEDGKSYRLSEISTFLKNNIDTYKFRDSRLPEYSDVKITAKGFVQFEGKPVFVAAYVKNYDGVLKRWD